MAAGTITIDLHGMTCYQAQVAIDTALRRAGRATYRLELVHGYHGGSAIRLRLELGLNPGITELVLREY